jgi:hypothetical protein
VAKLSFSAPLPKSSSKAPSRSVLVKLGGVGKLLLPIRPFGRRTRDRRSLRRRFAPSLTLASHHQLRARRRSWPRPLWRGTSWSRGGSWSRSGRCRWRWTRRRRYCSRCGRSHRGRRRRRSSSSCGCRSCSCSCSCWRRRGRVSSCWSWCRCVSSCRCSRSGCCRGGRCCRRWGWRECSCWTRSGRGRRSWAGWRDIDIALSASRRASGAVAEVLSKERVVSLHSGCGRCVAISHCAVDHVKA